MRVLAFLDGTLADPDTAQIKVDDLGLTRGDGVFETILVVGGKPRELRPHLDRLARSAAMLDLPEPDLAAWERAVSLVLEHWTGGPEMVLKLVYTRGPTVIPTPCRPGSRWVRSRDIGPEGACRGRRCGDPGTRFPAGPRRARAVAAAGREAVVVRHQHGRAARSRAAATPKM